MKFRLLTLVMASGLVLTGCASGTPTPAPSPTPSPVCTPEAGGDEYPCTQEEYEAMKAKDALYAEAEEVNREFRKLLEPFYRMQAPAEPPDELLALTAGSAEEDLRGLFSELHENGFLLTGGEFVYSVERNPAAAKEGSEVSLKVCVDASSATVRSESGEEWPGAVIVDYLYFKRVDGALKLWATDDEVVESCE